MDLKLYVYGDNQDVIVEELIEALKPYIAPKSDERKVISVTDINACIEVFNDFLNRYPEFDFSCSSVISPTREGDTSADWWESTSIKVVKSADGRRSCFLSSQTNWN